MEIDRMRIYLTSVFVDDQERALAFYTDVLGFVKKHDIPMGEHRWLTVVSPENPDGPELVLNTDYEASTIPVPEGVGNNIDTSVRLIR